MKTVVCILSFVLLMCSSVSAEMFVVSGPAGDVRVMVNMQGSYEINDLADMGISVKYLKEEGIFEVNESTVGAEPVMPVQLSELERYLPEAIQTLDISAKNTTNLLSDCKANPVGLIENCHIDTFWTPPSDERSIYYSIESLDKARDVLKNNPQEFISLWKMQISKNVKVLSVGINFNLFNTKEPYGGFNELYIDNRLIEKFSCSSEGLEAYTNSKGESFVYCRYYYGGLDVSVSKVSPSGLDRVANISIQDVGEFY